MSFIHPYALWGLLALTVPIIIHLLSKKKQKLIYFGTLRFLEPSEAPSARSIRLSEYTLLLIRLLFLAALVLALAGPVIEKKDNHHYRYVESPFHLDEEMLSTFSGNEIMPFTYDKEGCSECLYFPSAWALIHHINHNGDSNTVYSSNYLQDFKGTAIGLHPSNNWITLPEKLSDTVIDTMTTSSGLLILEKRENKGNIFFDKKEITGKGENINHISVKIIHGKEGMQAAHQIINLFKNLNPVLPVPIKISSEDHPDWKIHIDTLILTSNDQAVIQWETADDPLTIHPLSENRVFMKGSIDRSAIIEGNMALLLSDILLKKEIDWSKFDNRKMIVPKSNGNQDAEIIRASAGLHKTWSHWIWIIIVILLITERWMAGKKA